MPENPVAATLATYDRVAADYAARNGTPNDEFTPHLDSFAAAVGAGGVVADVGCGPGRDAVYFAERGLRIVGLDGSRAMLALARAAGVAVARGDLRALPVRDAALDGLWSNASLLHVPRSDVPATLRGWRRAVRDDGTLGLATSLGGDKGWEVVPYAPSHTDGNGQELHRWFVHHDRDELLGLVEAAGFRVTSVGERVSHRHWLQVLATAG
jgi:SAM-dependent methyltransferase